MSRLLKNDFKSIGFSLIGVTNTTLLGTDRKHLQNWIKKSYSAGMHYMVLEADSRADVLTRFPWAKSIISFGINYFNGPVPETPKVPSGRVARYAWGRDYHDVIRDRSSEAVNILKKMFGESVRAELAVDTQPILERGIARRAGIGFFGKNTNIISPTIGSWFLLSEIFTDIELEPDRQMNVRCGTCTRCSDSCPGGALSEPYILDARRCISYLTIEHRGWIRAEQRPVIGDRIFGCDDCQENCPINRNYSESKWEDFLPVKGAGAWLNLQKVLKIRSDTEFNTLFKDTSILRAKREGLVRNACIVCANIKAESLTPELISLIYEDKSPVVRGHAVWALGQFKEKKYNNIIEKALSDQDERVRNEAENILGNRSL